MLYRIRLRWRLLFADRIEAKHIRIALRRNTRQFCRR